MPIRGHAEIKPTFTFIRHDPGNCRTYYRRDQSRRLYCLQAGYGHEFDWLICSKDGEPSHEVAWPGRDAFDELVFPHD